MGLPRKGTETSAISLDGEWMPISTYPRKGTETGRVLHRIHSTGFQLIPARGRKHIKDGSLDQTRIISTYPRKGTETARSRACSRRRRFQLIPARGRKPPYNLFCAYKVRYFNLSPQGDGNCYGRFCNWLSGFQLIPTRGRKHWYDCIVVIFDRFQLIPARGRKRRTTPEISLPCWISTYPRKGAKNSASKKMRSFSFANLNSLFSVGYSSMNRAAAAFSLP